jgi:hypothetical protein
MGGDRFNPNNGELQNGLSKLDKAKYDIISILKFYKWIFEVEEGEYLNYNSIESLSFASQAMSLTLFAPYYGNNYPVQQMRCSIGLNISDISCDFFGYRSYEGIIVRFPSRKYLLDIITNGQTTKNERIISQIILLDLGMVGRNPIYSIAKLKAAFDELIRITKSQNK